MCPVLLEFKGTLLRWVKIKVRCSRCLDDNPVITCVTCTKCIIRRGTLCMRVQAEEEEDDDEDEDDDDEEEDEAENAKVFTVNKEYAVAPYACCLA